MTRGLLLLLTIAFALVTGCAGDRAKRDLSLYCQVKPCSCESATLSFGRKAANVPILWRDGGAAYCPPDYVLTPKEKDDSFKRRYGG